MPVDSKRLIFIGGVHGSGKTTIGSKAALSLGADFKSCSQIIRIERQAKIVSTPDIADVEMNQLALISGLKRLRSSSGTVILDGHFTLKTKNQGILPISISVFESMLPDVLFLVETSASVICRRLASRDGSCPTEADVLAHQENERRAAALVSRHLDRPLVVLNGDDADADQSLRSFLIP